MTGYTQAARDWQAAHPDILACPACGSIDLDTLEIATCVAECTVITTAGPEYSGTTDYERGEQDTTGVICNGCQWTYEGEDWLTKLEPHAHQWGPLEASHLAGTVHRKCQVPGCWYINALDDDPPEDEEDA